MSTAAEPPATRARPCPYPARRQPPADRSSTLSCQSHCSRCCQPPLLSSSSPPPTPLAVDLSALPQPLAVLRARAEGPAGTALDVPETTYYLLGTAHVSAESCDDVAALIRAVRPQVVLVELCAERRPILSADKASGRPTADCLRHVTACLPALSWLVGVRSGLSTDTAVLFPLLRSSGPPQVREPSLTEVLNEIRRGRATPFQGVYSWCAEGGRRRGWLAGAAAAAAGCPYPCQPPINRTPSWRLLPRNRLLAKLGRNLDVLPGEEFRVALREAQAIGAQVGLACLWRRLLSVLLGPPLRA